MAEHRIVVPGVVGSTPITHPTNIHFVRPGIQITSNTSFDHHFLTCLLSLHFILPLDQADIKSKSRAIHLEPRST